MTKTAQMKIGELARKTGKTAARASSLRGDGPARSRPSAPRAGLGSTARIEVARVYWITKLQDMGFSLPQIQALLASVAASATAPEAMLGVRELFRNKLDETRAQVLRLYQLERDLVESLSYLEGCRVCREPAAPQVCTSCTSERRSDEPTPSLVAQIHRGPAGQRGTQHGH
jgi:MerR family copper efflux transcriptional regulator